MQADNSEYNIPGLSSFSITAREIRSDDCILNFNHEGKMKRSEKVARNGNDGLGAGGSGENGENGPDGNDGLDGTRGMPSKCTKLGRTSSVTQIIHDTLCSIPRRNSKHKHIGCSLWMFQDHQNIRKMNC